MDNQLMCVTYIFVQCVIMQIYILSFLISVIYVFRWINANCVFLLSLFDGVGLELFTFS